MSNKRFLQFIAALWILAYHVWIPISSFTIESFIIRIGYVGVDIFFFLSAYSLADKDIQYGQLIKDRFINIYLKFGLFVLVAFVYKDIPVVRALKQVSMIEFFERGGGSFLWFLPAIFIFYLVYPLFLKWDNRYKVLLVLVGWLTISVLLERVAGYNKIFIFTNRIPIMLAGYLLKKRPVSKWILVSLIPIGVILVYLCGYNKRLNMPFNEFYFVVGAVLTLGIVGLSYFVPKNKIWEILGCATLELYGLQMIFGTKLSMAAYGLVSNALVSNTIAIALMFLVAIAINKAYAMLVKRVKALVSHE